MGTSLRSGPIALKAATTGKSTSPMTTQINRPTHARPRCCSNGLHSRRSYQGYRRTRPSNSTALLLQVRFPVFSETFSGGLHGITGVGAVLLAGVAIGNGLSLVIDYLHGGAVKSARIITAAVDGA